LIAAVFAAFVSFVSIATILAPTESATKSTPSGPKANGPADVNGTLPTGRLVVAAVVLVMDVKVNANAAAAQMLIAELILYFRRILISSAT
jgi:hypothetical protein